MEESNGHKSKKNVFSEVNTVLLTIVLGLSTWTLTRVSSLSEMMAVTNALSVVQQRDLDVLRTRLTQIETQQQRIQIDIVRLQKSTAP